MRSSNCKHYAKKQYNKKGHAKAGSVIVALIIAISAIVIPGATVIQNAEAVTDARNNTFSIGDVNAFSGVICGKGNVQSDLEEQPENKPAKAEKKIKVKTSKNTTNKSHKVVKETAPATESVTTQATTAPATEAPKLTVAKSNGLLAIIKLDPNYQPTHVTLTADQRDILERLVMGEAGSMGYTGCALVAQAVRDSMNLSKTASVTSIINEYQYTAPLDTKPNNAAKSAVSYIFDNDGYAVQHRVLYFYASNIVSNAWHESQEFIVSYGNVRFFDKW